MTEGSSQGLFVIVAVVIFGIFVVISYVLFRDNLKTGLASIFKDSIEESLENSEFQTDMKGEVLEDGTIVSKIRQGVWIKLTEHKPNELMIIESGTSKNDFSYGNKNHTGDLILPDSINGKKITRIRGEFIERTNAFLISNFNGRLKLPKYLTYIGDSAFKTSKFKGTLHLPDGIEEIGIDAFMSSEFTGSFKAPKSLKIMNRSAFQSSKFSGTLTIPETVTQFDNWVFTKSKFGKVVILTDLDNVSEDSIGMSENSLQSVLNNQVPFFTFDSNKLMSVKSTITSNIFSKEKYDLGKVVK